MSHRVHPKAYRIRRIDDWETRGYYKDPAEYLEEDFRIREFLKKKIGHVGIEKIEIERFSNKLNIIVFSARPGLIIGRGGEGIEKLKAELERKVLRKLSSDRIKRDKEIVEEEKKVKNKKKVKSSIIESLGDEGKKQVKIEIREIKDFWTSANLSAQWVAQRIEKRMPYRRVLKQGLSKISSHKEVQGVRIELSGRLNGAEIARREWLAEGKMPRQTLRANIDYAKVEAHCSYGIIGVKVWIYKGEQFE